MNSADAAVLARTSLRRASVAALITYPDGLSPAPLLTSVTVSACDDGSAVVLLRPDSPAARELLIRPVAVVQVAPQGCTPVSLHGAAHRLPSRDESGRVAYRIEAGAVRLGTRGEVGVESTAYASARPYPVATNAPAAPAGCRRSDGRRIAAPGVVPNARSGCRTTWGL